MGAWSTSINGNDTAESLRYEYTSAFWRYDVDTAVSKIDAYVRSEGIDETDSIAWCDYVYSLADYMYRKGILTDEIKQRALSMIETGFGLEEWEESGETILRKRKKVLAAFREKLLSPLPPKKKIKPDLYTNTIFTSGDIIAVQLQTAGKPYTRSDVKLMTDEEFQSLDGKYVIMQKIEDHFLWQSAIAPDVKDYWAVFRLFDGVFDEIPTQINYASLKDAKILGHKTITPLFSCESSMFYFKRRKYVLLGNDAESAEQYYDCDCGEVYWGINTPDSNPDSDLLCAMGKEITCQLYNGSLRALDEIIETSLRFDSEDNPHLSREENKMLVLKRKKAVFTELENLITSGGRLYTIQFGVTVGMASLYKGNIKHLFIDWTYRNYGFETELLKYVTERTGHHTDEI